MVRILIGRSCKNVDHHYDRVFDSNNLLVPEQVVLSQDCLDELTNTENQLKRTLFFKDAQSHYIAACKHILEKSALKSKVSILSDLKCLDPVHCKSSSYNSIVSAAKALPWDVETDVLTDEWKLLEIEKDSETQVNRIDEYWTRIFELKNPTGGPKYPTLSKVVKALLSLSHGNADVERGFSRSGRILADDRASMSETTLNSFLTVKHALKEYNNLPHAVPVTKEVLDMARCARRNYEEYLNTERTKKEHTERVRRQDEERKKDEEKRLREVSANLKKLQAEEDELVRLRKAEEEKLQRGAKLLKEANDRLKKGVEQGNMEEIALAQAMLAGVSQLRQEAEEQRREINKTQRTVE